MNMLADDKTRIAAARQNLETLAVVKSLSLNLVEKWRKMRESADYAKRYYLRPKLRGVYG